MPTSTMILLSLDLILFDFLSIFSHFFVYATGFTDQLLSLWFVCLAIFSPICCLFLVVFFPINSQSAEHIFSFAYFGNMCDAVFIERVFIMHTLADHCQIFVVVVVRFSHMHRLENKRKELKNWMMLWHKLHGRRGEKRRRRKKENRIEWNRISMNIMAGTTQNDTKYRTKIKRQCQWNTDRENQNPFTSLSLHRYRKWVRLDSGLNKVKSTNISWNVCVMYCACKFEDKSPFTPIYIFSLSTSNKMAFFYPTTHRTLDLIPCVFYFDHPSEILPNILEKRAGFSRS